MSHDTHLSIKIIELIQKLSQWCFRDLNPDWLAMSPIDSVHAAGYKT